MTKWGIYTVTSSSLHCIMLLKTCKLCGVSNLYVLTYVYTYVDAQNNNEIFRKLNVAAAMFTQKVMKQKYSQNLYAHKLCFLMPGHICICVCVLLSSYSGHLE